LIAQGGQVLIDAVGDERVNLSSIDELLARSQAFTGDGL
jgi:hypothetical protein